MQFLLLIYENESVNANRDPESHRQVFQEYGVFTQGLKDRGAFIAGDALEPVATATSVRVREGKRTITDGPFAETAEQLGGYYLVEAKDLDDAIEMASAIPASRFGCVEVRPLMVFEQPPGSGPAL